MRLTQLAQESRTILMRLHALCKSWMPIRKECRWWPRLPRRTFLSFSRSRRQVSGTFSPLIRRLRSVLSGSRDSLRNIKDKNGSLTLNLLLLTRRLKIGGVLFGRAVELLSRGLNGLPQSSGSEHQISGNTFRKNISSGFHQSSHRVLDLLDRCACGELNGNRPVRLSIGICDLGKIHCHNVSKLPGRFLHGIQHFWLRHLLWHGHQDALRFHNFICRAFLRDLSFSKHFKFPPRHYSAGPDHL